jgi:two-component system, OmpR family, sensor histidine kinase TctE
VSDSEAGPREQRSLFGEILDWMLAPLLLLWPLSVVLTWLVAQGIAAKPFDRELGERVRVLAREVSTRNESDAAPAGFTLTLPAADAARTEAPDVLYYQVLGPRGEHLGGDAALPLPGDEDRALPGEVRFRDERIGDEPVRVAYMWVGTPERAADRSAGGPSANGARGGAPTASADAPLVQVAETLGKRSRLATEIIKGVILPQFVILPVAVLLVWLALARGIAPLNELQQRIRRRDSSDLSPIDVTQAPEEVSPLVRAINDLLARLDQSLRAQKHFLADAAHQLKTPLAGLRTQAELAQRQIDAGEADPQALKKSLQQIARSSQRAAHMVNQLLAMARAENQQQVAQRQVVNLARLATETVRDFVPRALEKRIDLGYEGPTDATAARHPRGPQVLGHALLLRELIRNLVDNALQYTPAGGTVTVRVIDDPFGQVVVLQVEDSGPGIAASERELVFQPFYRSLGTEVDGSGLGLAIVREIATQHGAEISIGDASGRSTSPGTLMTVRLTASTAAAEPEVDAEAAPAISSGSGADSSRSTSESPDPARA